VKVEGAPADAKRYNNLFWGPAQGTGGSTAMANSWDQLRQPAPPPAPCWCGGGQALEGAGRRDHVREGVVSHAASKRKARFGELAEAAARPKPCRPAWR
jgi:isoquinoline 1-oxidoreductase beta subunit